MELAYGQIDSGDGTPAACAACGGTRFDSEYPVWPGHGTYAGKLVHYCCWRDDPARERASSADDRFDPSLSLHGGNGVSGWFNPTVGPRHPR